MIENLPAMRETQVPSLGQLDCPEKRMAAYSSIFLENSMDKGVAGYIQSMGCRESDMTELLTF